MRSRHEFEGRRSMPRHGFTLTELLVAVVVLLVIIPAVGRIFGTALSGFALLALHSSFWSIITLSSKRRQSHAPKPPPNSELAYCSCKVLAAQGFIQSLNAAPL